MEIPKSNMGQKLASLMNIGPPTYIFQPKKNIKMKANEYLEMALPDIIDPDNNTCTTNIKFGSAESFVKVVTGKSLAISPALKDYGSHILLITLTDNHPIYPKSSKYEVVIDVALPETLE